MEVGATAEIGEACTVSVLPKTVNHAVRTEIVNLEHDLKVLVSDYGFKEADCPLTHHFAPGAYGREIFIPADSLLVGKIHKHAHLNMVMKGKVTVGTEDGVRQIEAPCVFVSQPGTKRVVYAHTDTIWVTVHVTESHDLEEIEEQIIAKSYDDYDAQLQTIIHETLIEATAQKEALCPGLPQE